MIYAIAKNITHKKQNEEERNQLLSELSKTNSHLRKLNYTNSHDLRGPVSNLITNSIKYAHPDRDPIITIKTEITNGKKKLIFSDNGIGFDSEKQKTDIFVHETKAGVLEETETGSRYQCGSLFYYFVHKQTPFT